jgi:hypothetical protein
MSYWIREEPLLAFSQVKFMGCLAKGRGNVSLTFSPSHFLTLSLSYGL